MARSKKLEAALGRFSERRAENPKTYTETYNADRINQMAENYRNAVKEAQQTRAKKAAAAVNTQRNSGVLSSAMAAEGAARFTPHAAKSTGGTGKTGNASSGAKGSTGTKGASSKNDDRLLNNAKNKLSVEDIQNAASKYSGQNVKPTTLEELAASYRDPRADRTKHVWDNSNESYNDRYSLFKRAATGNLYEIDPDSIYKTDDMTDTERTLYRLAAEKDSDNPLMQALSSNITDEIRAYEDKEPASGYAGYNVLSDSTRKKLNASEGTAPSPKRGNTTQLLPGGKKVTSPSRLQTTDSLPYNYMTSAEKNRYNEIYGRYGRDAAEDYKNLILDELNQRMGQTAYEVKHKDDNTALKAAQMFYSGVGSSLEGLLSVPGAVTGKLTPQATSSQDYMIQAMRNDPDNNAAQNIIYDIAQSTGYMAPGLAVSAATGGAALGNAVFALSQYGNTYQDDINMGRSSSASQLHALQQGIDETATNWLLGGIGAFGGGALKSAIAANGGSTLVRKAVERLTRNESARKALIKLADFMADAGSEAVQEYTQYFTNAITENLLFNAGNDLSLLNDEALYSALVGGLNAAVLNMPGTIAQGVRSRNTDTAAPVNAADATARRNGRNTAPADAVNGNVSGIYDDEYGSIDEHTGSDHNVQGTGSSAASAVQTIRDEADEQTAAAISGQQAYDDAMAAAYYAESGNIQEEADAVREQAMQMLRQSAEQDAAQSTSDSTSDGSLNDAAISDQASEIWNDGFEVSDESETVPQADAVIVDDIELQKAELDAPVYNSDVYADYSEISNDAAEYNASDNSRESVGVNAATAESVRNNEQNTGNTGSTAESGSSAAIAEIARRAKARFGSDAAAQAVYTDNYNGQDITYYDGGMSRAYETGLKGASLKALSDDAAFMSFYRGNADAAEAMLKSGYAKREENGRGVKAAAATAKNAAANTAKTAASENNSGSSKAQERRVTDRQREAYRQYVSELTAALATAESTEHMVEQWNGQNREKYTSAYKRVYSAGLNHVDKSTVSKNPGNMYLTKAAIDQAYADGEKDSRRGTDKTLVKGEERKGGITRGRELAGKEQAKFLDWVGDKTGLKIEVSEDLRGSAEIDLENGIMRINPYSADFVGSVSHELTHLLKEYAPKEYKSLQEMTVDALMQSEDVSYEELYARYEEAYRREHPEYTVEDILEEITADGATAYMNDAEFAERIARADSSLAKKIADFFKGIADALKALINEKGIRKVGRVMRENEARYGIAANTWMNAVEQAGTKYKEGYTAETTDGTKYQIKETEKGTKYVEVDVDQEMFDSLTPLERIDFAAKIIKERFQGRTLSNNYIDATITRATFKKYGRHTGDEEFLDSKARASTVFDQIFEISEFLGHKDNEKEKHSSAVNGWDYYSTLFKIGDKYYSAAFVVRKDVDKNVIYDLEKIKEVDNPDQMPFPGLDAPVVYPDKEVSTSVNHTIASKAETGKTKFQLNEPYEETRDLIALHNKSVSSLEKALDLGGIPMPSIAIVKAEQGHDAYGPVSLVFRKDTIDPEASSYNKVYTGDAWTPIFPEVDTEIKEEKLGPIKEKLRQYIRSNPKDVFNDIRLDGGNFTNYLKKANGSIEKLADNSYDLKLMYLDEKGDGFGELPSHEETVRESYSGKATNDEIIELSGMISRLVAQYEQDGRPQEFSRQHKEEILSALGEVTGKDYSTLPAFKQNVTSWSAFDGVLSYLNGESPVKLERVIDLDEAKRQIDARINESDYHEWAKKTFKGVIGRQGIPNGRDVYDRNGNRRSFSQTHMAMNLDNLVKAMRKIGNGENTLSAGMSIWGVSQEEYGSIRDIKKDSGRLEQLSSEEIDRRKSKLLDRFTDIVQTVTNKRADNFLLADDNAARVLTDGIRETRDEIKLAKYILKYTKHNGVTADTAKKAAADMIKLARDIRNLPVAYFEAKPERAVTFDEVVLAVLPDDTDTRLIDRLKAAGVETVATYKTGDEADRTKMLNNAVDLKFQLNIDDDHTGRISDIGRYNFSTYNRYGWAYVNGLMDDVSSRQMFKAIAELDLDYDLPTAHNGDYIIEVSTRESDFNDTLVFVDASEYDEESNISPIIDKVIKFNVANETEATDIKEYIYGREKQDTLESEAIKSFIGKERIEIYSRGDFGSYWDIREGRRAKGERIESSDSNRTEHDNGGAATEGPRDLRRQLDIDDESDGFIGNTVMHSSPELRSAAENLSGFLSYIHYVPDDATIRQTASKIKKYTESARSVSDIAEQLKTVYEFIANSSRVDGAYMSEIAADFAGELITDGKPKYDKADVRRYRDIRDTLKVHTFHMPEGFEGEVATLGGLSALRREFFGTLNITKDKGSGIDSIYQEISDRYPELFDPDAANPADQLERIVDGLRAAKPQPVRSWQTDEDYDSFRYYAGQMVFEAYMEPGRTARNLNREADALRAANAGLEAENYSLRQSADKNRADQDEMAALQSLAADLTAQNVELNEALKNVTADEKELAMLQSKAAEYEARYLTELAASRKKVSKERMLTRVRAARQSAKAEYHKKQIIKDTKELSNWLLKPTDAKHVPESLREPLAEFLTNIDFSSKQDHPNGDPTQRTLLWLKLKSAWAAIADKGGIAEDGGRVAYIEFDPDIIANMESLTDKIASMSRMEDLDYTGLVTMEAVIKSMKHAITTANKLMSTKRYQTVSDAARTTLDELSHSKTRTDRPGARGTITNLLANQMLTADTRFHTFGKAAEDIYQGMRRRFNLKVRRTAEAADAFADMLRKAGVTDKVINEWSGTKAEGISITTARGEELKLTTAQVMSLYELMQRPQAKDHILNGGITSQRLNWKGKIMKTGNVKVTEADVRALTDQLTTEQRRMADEITRYFQTTAQWGNNASMELYGYKKFNDPKYFPIKVDSNFLHTSSDDAARNTDAVSFKNMGLTKSTIPHASNPLIVDDIFDVFTKQVNDMSNYEAFVVPLADMQKWYNYKDSEPGSMYNSSIKKTLERVYGSEANAYVKKFMQDINGMSTTERYFANGLVSAFKGSAVGFNLSVAIQQPTAFVRALYEIDPKYLIAALGSKTEAGDWETIKKYSAIAQWKDWGFNEMDTGRTMRSILVSPNNVIDKLNDKQMWLAGKGDEITWKRLWTAAEIKVKAEHKELAVGSDAFYAKTAEIFDGIIDRTQVVDSTFHRTDVMRSKNSATQMSTSFMAEPMKSYNMLYRALFDYRNASGDDKKKYGSYLMRAVIAFLLSAATSAMAKSVITAMRDKQEDRDKAYWERWKEHTAEEFLGNIAPTNYIPFVRDVVSIFDGYTVGRSDLSAFQDLYYVWQRWQKVIDGTGSNTIPANLLYSTKVLSSMTGVAFYGLQRDVNAVIDTAIEAATAAGIDMAADAGYAKQRVFGYDITKSGSTASYVNMALRAYMQGNNELGDRIIGDLKKAGIEDDKIRNRFKSALKKKAEEKSGSESSTFTDSDLWSLAMEMQQENPDINAADIFEMSSSHAGYLESYMDAGADIEAFGAFLEIDGLKSDPGEDGMKASEKKLAAFKENTDWSESTKAKLWSILYSSDYQKKKSSSGKKSSSKK